MDLTTGTVISDRYTIEGVLGEGGMAVVYKARHAQLGTLHALKVLSFTSRSVRERLLMEGRVQASLRHPNIVAVTDVVDINGQPGLVMELIEGPSLDDLLKQQKLTLEQVDVIGRGVLAGVAHAHGRGLVHRDLKPANVMLQIDEQGVTPKVMDFGLAKVVEADEGRARTRTGATMGTPQYMSPEQIEDSKSVDARSDVFGVGAILYELVTGDRAFDGGHLLEIFKKVTTGTYTDPRSLRPDVPERMVEAIQAALQVERDERIESCKKLYEVWTAGEAMPAHSFSSEDLAMLARSMLPATSQQARAEATSEIDLSDVAAPGSLAGAAVTPSSASSLSMAPSLMVGGGLLTVGLGLLGLVAVALLGVGVWWATKEPVVVTETVTEVVEKEVIREVKVPSRDATPAPAPSNNTVATAPSGDRTADDPAEAAPDDDPDADAPDGADANDDTLADTDDPDATADGEGDPDADAVPAGVDPDAMAWEDLPEEMQDPDYRPEDADPAEDPADGDATADATDVAPEPVPPAPVRPEDAPLSSLPMSLRSQTRLGAIESATDRADLRDALITVFHKDPDANVRKAAFVTLMVQWRRGVGGRGARGALQRQAAYAIRGSDNWMKRHALEAWIHEGRSLQAPSEALNDEADHRVRRLAAEALARAAQRTGQNAEALPILAGRSAIEQDKGVLKELAKATEALK
jgi:serine/threonine-protein kinase